MIVRKLANASPGLKFIRFITFSSIQMFFLLYFVSIELKTENLTAKLQNSNQNCTFSWVNNLIGFSTTWPREGFEKAKKVLATFKKPVQIKVEFTY